jgi:hypothetical protein
MPILADTVDGVIGVDTHRDTLAAAAVSPVGGILAQTATRPTPPATGSCWSSPARRSPATRRGAAGRWRAPAATAPG